MTSKNVDAFLTFARIELESVAGTMYAAKREPGRFKDENMRYRRRAYSKSSKELSGLLKALELVSEKLLKGSKYHAQGAAITGLRQEFEEKKEEMDGLLYIKLTMA